jgi:hypothetical protein
MNNLKLISAFTFKSIVELHELSYLLFFKFFMLQCIYRFVLFLNG